MDNQTFIILNQSDFKALEAKVDLVLSKLDKRVSDSAKQFGKWIPEKEVKKILSLSTTSLWKLRKEGKLEFSKPNNSTVYYSQESIMAWIEKNRKKEFSKKG